MAELTTWDSFLEGKKDAMKCPPQGKGTNPYMNVDPDGKLRVVEEPDAGKPLGEMGGSNVTPEDSSLGEPGGKGGVPITNEAKGKSKGKLDVAYPGGKVDGRIRVTKDKEKGKDWGDLRTPGMDPSVSSLGEPPGKGVGTTTENSEDESGMPTFSDFCSQKKK